MPASKCTRVRDVGEGNFGPVGRYLFRLGTLHLVQELDSASRLDFRLWRYGKGEGGQYSRIARRQHAEEEGLTSLCRTCTTRRRTWFIGLWYARVHSAPTVRSDSFACMGPSRALAVSSSLSSNGIAPAAPMSSWSHNMAGRDKHRTDQKPPTATRDVPFATENETLEVRVLLPSPCSRGSCTQGCRWPPRPCPWPPGIPPPPRSEPEQGCTQRHGSRLDFPARPERQRLRHARPRSSAESKCVLLPNKGSIFLTSLS